MTLSKQLDLANHDSFYKWVPAAAEETGVDEELLWNIAETLLLEPESVDHIETELKLKILYEIHLNRIRGTDKDALGSWVNVVFDTGERKGKFQFSYGMFNVPFPEGEEQEEAMKKLMREENLEPQHADSEAIMTRNTDCGPVWAVRINERILQDVYDASLGDIVRVEEEGEPRFTQRWDEVVEDR